MRPHRREFLKTVAVPALAPLATGPAAGEALSGYKPGNTYDVAVIGAGVFGSWTAHHLLQAGKKVLLIDQYGASNSRASSGGESRIIRMGYGDDEIYTRSSQRALELWKEFFQRTGNPLFHQCGVLWLARGNDSRIPKTTETLARTGVKFEKLSRSELEKRFPQINFGSAGWGVYEPGSGALMARQAVQAVVKDFVHQGGHFLPEPVAEPSTSNRIALVSTRSGDKISAGSFIFACGPWLPKVFPALLGNRIFPTRQDIFFFAVPPGDRRWTPPAMPAWIDVDLYGIPDLENRGFKIANDQHGPPFDPDSSDRFVTKEQIAEMRRRLGQLFPGLKDAPLVESRVCQYENSSNGDFLVDAHPEMNDVWLLGGGSGHGFKHGPALGEYVATQVLKTGRPPEPRYSLRSKGIVQKRSVF
jgi:monomeric sarcosine oxidase